MATSVTFGGITYSIPSENETGWGEQVMAFLVAVAQKTLSTSGGNFLLSGQLNFGSSFGIKLVNITSSSNNVSDAGFLRLSNTDSIAFRNSANDGNLLLELSSNKIRFGGSELVDLGSSQTLLLKAIDADSNSISNIEVENFKASAIDTDISSVSASDDTLPSAKAVKTYIDAEVSDLSSTVATNLANQKDVVEVLVGKTLTSPTLNDATFGGTTTIVNSTELEVTDPHIEVNKDGSDATSEGAGLIVDRTGTKGAIEYAAASGTKFKIGAAGALEDIVGVSATQTLAGKTLTSPVINTPSLANSIITNHIDYKTQGSDPSGTPGTNDLFVYNKGGQLYQKNDDDISTPIGGAGGGGGALNLWTQGNAESLPVSDFVTSGTGTFAVSSTAADLINPQRSFKISSASTAFYVETPNILIPLGYRNRLIGIQFPYRSSDGAEMILDVYDESGTLISTSPALVDSSSSSVGSAQFRYVFQVGDNDIIRLRFRATGTVAEFIWDDVIVTPDPLITLPDTTWSLSGGDNILSLSKFIISNDNRASRGATNGSNSQTATLTEDTDYIDAGDWIESIVCDTTTAYASSPLTSSGLTKYTITTKADIFGDRLPVIDMDPIAVTGAGATIPTNVNLSGDFTIRSTTFSGTKVVIVIQSDFTGGIPNSTLTAAAMTFGLTAVKTSNFSEPTLVPNTTQKVVTYAESIDRVVEYTANYAINSGDISIGDVTNQQRNGVAFTWISSVNDNANTGQIDFLFNTAETGFTVIPEINMIPSNSSGATQGWLANSSTSQFRYNGQSLVNGNVSMITQSGRIVVKPSGADVLQPLPTGTFIVTPAASQLVELREYFTPGTFTYTTPKDCTLLEIEASGGGGGGQSGAISIGVGQAVGGGSGEYGSRNITVLPETSYQIIIGAAGTGGAGLSGGIGQNSGVAGGETSFDKGNGLEVLWLGGNVSSTGRRLDGSEDFYIGPAGAYPENGNGYPAYLGAPFTGGGSSGVNPSTYGGTNGKALGGAPGSGRRGVNTAAYGSGAGGGAGWVRGLSATSTASSGTSTSTTPGANGGTGGMVVKAYTSVTKSVITS